MITEYNRSVRCTKITGHTRDDSDVCSTIKHWGLIRSSDYRRCHGRLYYNVTLGPNQQE